MERKGVRLYNVMFPLWFFFVYPTLLWLVILPVNFAIDSLVLHLAAKKQKIKDMKALWKKSILRVWLIGFLSDVLGGSVCLLLLYLADVVPFLGWITKLPYVAMQVVTGIPGVVVAGVLIYYFNRLISFKKTSLEKGQIQKICRALAWFTAPYAMMIPLYW